MRFAHALAVAAGLYVFPLAGGSEAQGVEVRVTGGSADLSLPLNDTSAPPATLIGRSSDLTQVSAGKTEVVERSPVNADTAADRPTTATFDTDNPAGTFNGTIELRGFATYLIPGPSNQVELGDFSLGYDATRVGTLGGQASGFYLRDTRAGAPPIPFDLASGFQFTSDVSQLRLNATLLTASDLSARYEPFVGSQVGKPFGGIVLTASVEPLGATAVPLPSATIPGVLTLAGIVTATLVRGRSRWRA